MDWLHSVQDAAAMVRDFTKFDDSPVSLPQFAESSIRAYNRDDRPIGLVVVVADAELSETPIVDRTDLTIPVLPWLRLPAGDSASVAEIARMLIAAEKGRAQWPASGPHAGRRKTPRWKLAGSCKGAVVVYHQRMNFPNRHPLNLSGNSRALVENADLILGLEVPDFYGLVNAISKQLEYGSRRITKAKLACISAGDRLAKSNYQEFQRYQPMDLDIAADGEATLPSLIEAVKRQMTGDKKRAFEGRGAKLAEQHAGILAKARMIALPCAPGIRAYQARPPCAPRSWAPDPSRGLVLRLRLPRFCQQLAAAALVR